jgi:hypothetical protein
MSGPNRMPWRGVLVLTATWVFFTAVVFAQFCFLALVPVLAPVFALQVVGAACLLTEAYSYVRGLPRRPLRRNEPAESVHRSADRLTFARGPTTSTY